MCATSTPNARISPGKHCTQNGFRRLLFPTFQTCGDGFGESEIPETRSSGMPWKQSGADESVERHSVLSGNVGCVQSLYIPP